MTNPSGGIPRLLLLLPPSLLSCPFLLSLPESSSSSSSSSGSSATCVRSSALGILWNGEEDVSCGIDAIDDDDEVLIGTRADQLDDRWIFRGSRGYIRKVFVRRSLWIRLAGVMQFLYAACVSYGRWLRERYLIRHDSVMGQTSFLTKFLLQKNLQHICYK